MQLLNRVEQLHELPRRPRDVLLACVKVLLAATYMHSRLFSRHTGLTLRQAGVIKQSSKAECGTS